MFLIRIFMQLGFYFTPPHLFLFIQKYTPAKMDSVILDPPFDNCAKDE